MKSFFKKCHKFALWQMTVFLFLSILISFYYNLSFFSGTSPYFVITMMILIIGLKYGLIVSLGSSVLIMFFIGSYVCWSVWNGADHWTYDHLFTVLVSFLFFIAAAVLSGRFHLFFSQILSENEDMKGKFDQLVSIDELTGMDLRKRFFLEMEEEFTRSRRYGHSLTLLLVEIQYYEQFMAMYGEREVWHLIESLADQLREVTRSSDKKFRIAQGIFAIMLTDTEEELAATVIDKIQSKMSTHLLLNKQKQVTLTLSFGYSSYHQHLQDYMEMYDIAQKDLDSYVQ